MKDNVNINLEIDYGVFSTITEFNRKNNINRVYLNHLPFNKFNCSITMKIDDEDQLDFDVISEKLKDIPIDKRKKIIKEYKEKLSQTKEERVDIRISISDLILNIRCEGTTEIELGLKDNYIDISQSIDKNVSYLRNRILSPSLEELVKTSEQDKNNYDDFLCTTVVNTIELLAYISSDHKVDIPKEKLFTKSSETVTRRMSKKKKGKNKKSSLIRNINYIISKEDVISNTEQYSKREYNRQTDKWFTKGFWRTYKSGKKVWIKPCIKKSRKEVDIPNQQDTIEKIYKVV